jgi:2-methylcitrate synthase
MTKQNRHPGFKPKKSVALSGVAAGNTALCSVGRSGNDLHYRGYDILDVADTSNSRRSPTCWCTASCRTPPN